jgi:hypothetical protein
MLSSHLRLGLPSGLLPSGLPTRMVYALATVARMWFMHDGAPALFSREVRMWLNRRFQQRWIGWRGRVAWPARSPDLNPVEFFLWGQCKGLVYATPVQTVEVMWQRILHAAEVVHGTPGMLERVRASLLRRADSCIRAG